MSRSDQSTRPGRAWRITIATVSVAVGASVGSTFIAPPAEAVIGGKTVRSISDAPWIAEVMSAGVCSASVIASHWILTAAHCVVDKWGSGVLPGYFVVHSLQFRPPMDLGTPFSGKDVIVHPKFRDPGYAGPYDVALIHSAATIAGPYLHLAGPKDTARWKARTFATLFGYGKHSDKDRHGRQLTKKKGHCCIEPARRLPDLGRSPK